MKREPMTVAELIKFLTDNAMPDDIVRLEDGGDVVVGVKVEDGRDPRYPSGGY